MWARKVFQHCTYFEEINAEKNSDRTSIKGHRHDDVVKKFASSLFCLIGKASYEMLQSNFGSTLPLSSTVQRDISSTVKIEEGDFWFDQLVDHLKEWEAPMGANIQLDDTCILKKVEYDPISGRFVGFCLPVKDGFPLGDSFMLETFEEIENACMSYAHCIVTKPVVPVTPSFVSFVLGTDSKYTHN